MYVESSNVRGADYDDLYGELLVQYDDGQVWAYKISPEQAADFFAADSKGTWLWDNVRVRGTKHRHRVPARRLV